MSKVVKTVTTYRKLYVYLGLQTNELTTMEEPMADERGYKLLTVRTIGRDRIRYSMDLDKFVKLAESEHIEHVSVTDPATLDGTSV